MGSEKTAWRTPRAAVWQLEQALTQFCSVFYLEPKSGYSFTQKISEFCLCAGHYLRHVNDFYLAVLLSTLEQWFSTWHWEREQFLLPTRTIGNVQRPLVGPRMLLNIPQSTAQPTRVRNRQLQRETLLLRSTFHSSLLDNHLTHVTSVFSFYSKIKL